jgi:large subunit ribosomal protein L34e
MTKPMHKSRSWRRKNVKTPGSRSVIRYGKKKSGMAMCAVCKKPLHGVPRVREIEMKKLTKTERRPERPFGGNLCSSCMREIMRNRARNIK